MKAAAGHQLIQGHFLPLFLPADSIWSMLGTSQSPMDSTKTGCQHLQLSPPWKSHFPRDPLPCCSNCWVTSATLAAASHLVEVDAGMRLNYSRLMLTDVCTRSINLHPQLCTPSCLLPTADIPAARRDRWTYLYLTTSSLCFINIHETLA